MSNDGACEVFSDSVFVEAPFRSGEHSPRSTTPVRGYGPFVVTAPEPNYVFDGDVSIAYQVIGIGPPDLLVVMGVGGSIEVQWELSDSTRGGRRWPSLPGS